MEITNNIDKLLPKTETANLMPAFNSFDNHFIMAEKSEFLKIPTLDLLNMAEIEWKKIENFEFQKMDINASFEQMIKRI